MDARALKTYARERVAFERDDGTIASGRVSRIAEYILSPSHNDAAHTSTVRDASACSSVADTDRVPSRLPRTFQ